MKNLIKRPDRLSKAFLWIPLACFLGLTLALGGGCGLIGGGDKPTPEKSDVKTKVGAKATVPAAAKKEAAAAKTEEELSLEKVVKEKEERAKSFVYTREGKNDPFYPIEAVLAAKPEPAGGPPSEEAPPIERMGLSQFKLVAVVVAGDRTRALVEDSTGTGYIIKTGTKIGNKGGKVMEINPGEVQIEESFKNKYTGKVTRQMSVLSLKPVEGEKK